MIIAFLFVLINLLSLRNLPHSMSPHELPFGLNCKKTVLIALLFLYCLLLLCYVVIVGHYLRYLNTNRKISSVMLNGGVGMIVLSLLSLFIKCCFTTIQNNSSLVVEEVTARALVTLYYLSDYFPYYFWGLGGGGGAFLDGVGTSLTLPESPFAQ